MPVIAIKAATGIDFYLYFQITAAPVFARISG